MAYRSEQNRIPNKQNYKDLNLTFYPNILDTRTNNENMRGFINVGEGEIPDYVMAEYVNSALDGVMAIQRSLGETPMVPFDIDTEDINSIIEEKTVSNRIQRIEDGLFDERYGGVGWQFIPGRPTLSSHNHDGQNGHPGKIHLQNEVESLLRKRNIDLTINSGLLGSDIFVSNQNGLKIDKAIEDSLSKSAGGIVEGPTDFKGRFSSRTRMDFSARELSRGSTSSLDSDNLSSFGESLSLESGSIRQTVFSVTSEEREHLLFGKYILSIRLKASEENDNAFARISLGENVQTLSATDVSEKYKQIYFVFEQDTESVEEDLILEKLPTANDMTIHVDSVFIEPIHPAVLDR